MELPNTIPEPRVMHGVFVHEKFLEMFDIAPEVDAPDAVLDEFVANLESNGRVAFMTHSHFKETFGFSSYDLGDDDEEFACIQEYTRHATVAYTIQASAVMFCHPVKESKPNHKNGRERALGRFYKRLLQNGKTITTLWKNHGTSMVFGPLPKPPRGSFLEKEAIGFTYPVPVSELPSMNIPRPFSPSWSAAINKRLECARQSLMSRPGCGADWTANLVTFLEDAEKAQTEERKERGKMGKKSRQRKRERRRAQQAQTQRASLTRKPLKEARLRKNVADGEVKDEQVDTPEPPEDVGE